MSARRCCHRIFIHGGRVTRRVRTVVKRGRALAMSVTTLRTRRQTTRASYGTVSRRQQGGGRRLTGTRARLTRAQQRVGASGLGNITIGTAAGTMREVKTLFRSPGPTECRGRVTSLRKMVTSGSGYVKRLRRRVGAVRTKRSGRITGLGRRTRRIVGTLVHISRLYPCMGKLLG